MRDDLVDAVRAAARPLTGAAGDHDELLGHALHPLERNAEWHDAEAPETCPVGL